MSILEAFKTKRLLLAVKKSKTDDVIKVLKNGAKVDAKNWKGLSPLMIASQSEKNDVLKLLIQSGADLNMQNKKGETALILACRRDRYDTVKQLIEAGADLNIKDKHGWTALFYAAIVRDYSLVELLIKSGADINTKDKKGCTTLFNLAVSEIEIQRKIQSIPISSVGSGFLSKTQNEKYAYIVKLLVESGADFKETSIARLIVILKNIDLPNDTKLFIVNSIKESLRQSIL